MAEFRILGPLEVVVEGRRVLVGSRRQRAALVTLLVNANRVTPIDQLLAALWSGEPPETAVGQIHTLVWRLRGTLGDAISTQPGGYRLDVQPGELDADLFAELVGQAGRLVRDGQLTEAAERYTTALALWRGTAFADLDLPGDAQASGLAAATAELVEQRLAAERDRVDAELALGRHAELLPGLHRQVEAEPLREESRERLMLALYRSGRRAEALEVYRQGRDVIVAELGLEPGGALQRLHARMLAGDPELDVPGPARTAPAPVSGPPPAAQLPVDVADFAGRTDVVGALVAALTPAPGATAPGGTATAALSATATSGTPPLVAVSGAAGSGKTALAVHLAHRVRAHYPDGQLFADLRGVDAPLDPGEVLARFLRALGEDARTMPVDPDERAALFRARTAGRRLLIVLDNAAGEVQVRPLLPAEPGCAVIVTSRPRLGTLPGAHHWELGVFRLDEALELMRRTVGSARVDAAAADCARVVERCGHLPLAIRIASARLAARPHWPVARLADQLADERARLDVLRTGDLEVRSSLALSYQALAPAQQRAFRLLGTLDVPDLAGWVAAPLLDLPVAAAEELVEGLVEARLVQAGTAGAGPVRYRFHDLVRAYARELAEGTDDDVPACLGRAFGAWLALAEAAYDRLPGGFRRVGRGTAARWSWPDAAVDALLADPAGWYESERTALVAVVRQAATSGSDELAWDLAGVLARFFELREHLDDWRVTHELALKSCVAAGNRRGEAYLLRGLGELYLDTDRLDEALDCFAPALAILSELGERPGEGAVLRAAGTAYRLAGRDAEAMESLTRAEAVYVELDDRLGQAQALHNLGVLHRRAGRLADAEDAYRRALAHFAELGDPFGEAYVRCSLGIVLGGRPGSEDDADRQLARSVALCRELGYRRGEALAIGHLGELHVRLGRHEQATVELRAAVTGCREVSDGPGEAIGLRRLGELYAATGNPTAARSALHQCLALCQVYDLPDEREKSLRTLGRLPLVPAESSPAGPMLLPAADGDRAGRTAGGRTG